MRYIPIENAQAGQVLGLAIFDSAGRTLVAAGVKLNKPIIKRLKELGIPSISIEDEMSEGIDCYDEISQKIKPKSIEHLKNFNLDKALEDANAIVDEILKCNDVYEYFNIKTFDNYTYEHSLSVATYAAMMGLACGFNEEEIRKLTIAGILHDIGKQCIDSAILNKPSRLSQDEFNEIKKHTLLGYNMVKNNTDLVATIKIVILEHHENEDGSGYPRGITGKDIYKFSKIVHIVDVYDALISKRPYKDPMNPKEAIDFIIEKTGTMFSEEYVNVFIQIMPSYPRGSIVMLNDGRKAIVLKNHIGAIHSPDVRILDTKEVIKLRVNQDIKIIDTIQD